ncbi:MAG: baseplate J/gp47 family protein [Oscillospiraceae bacterium]
MYEAITYEEILERMLNRVPNTVDKREGSIIFDALAPAAIELQNMYIELDVILDETFADTASRECLIKRAAERGVFPEAATHAVLKGEFNIDIPIGSRYSLEGQNYIAEEKMASGSYKLRCETAGEIGNAFLGDLIPIEYLERLTSAKLTALLIPGENEESTEHFRTRYMANLSNQAFGGNISDYRQKVLALDGVGSVRITPVWNGGGTVKVTFLNSAFDVPSANLVTIVQTAIDPMQSSGKGMGIAPIGHRVTVEPAGQTIVNINTTITYQNGWNWNEIKLSAEAAIDAYFLELAKSWESTAGIVARISQIETRLLNLNGVLDISNTTLNGSANNLLLAEYNIPKRGVIVA